MVNEQMAYEHGDYLRRQAAAFEREGLSARVRRALGRCEPHAARLVATAGAVLHRRPVTAGCEA